MITNKINEKLTKKKQYTVCIDKEGLFSVAVVTALGMLNKDNRVLDCVNNNYAVLILNMDMKQKAAIELALSDYLVAIDVDEEPKAKVKAVVWK